jgi:tetratricopeptide (TPR) repeat protein
MNRFYLLISVILALPSISMAQSFNGDAVLLNIVTGKLTEAETALKTAPNQQKATARWSYLSGRLALVKEDFDGAIPHFKKALELDSKSAEYQYWVGSSTCLATERANVFRQAFMAGRCKEELEKTLSMDSNHIHARMSLIEFHLKAPAIVGGSYEEAESLSKELMRIQPFFGYVSQYQISMSRQDTLAGLKSLENGAKALPDSIWFNFNLGNLYESRKQYDLSYQNFLSAHQKKPEAWAVAFQLGRLAATTGLYLDEAMPIMDQIIKNRPADMTDQVYSMAHTRIGQIYLHKGNRALAKQHFETAVKIRFDNPVAIEELKKLN